jgi:serine/threonine-protein kinase
MMQLKVSCYGCGQKLDLSDLEPFLKIQCPVCSTELIIPKPFGNLLLQENVSRGEMAEVYRAIDITLDRQIAVKMLRDDLAGDPDIARLFLSEASTASAINHPNLVPIYSCGEMEGHHYIVMQFMDGGDLLARATAEEGPELRELYQWCTDTAKGLESAYIHGVVHHDVRPSNILSDEEGNIKVCDFGLRQILSRNQSLDVDALPADGGHDAFYYISPEKVSTGREDVTGDIFSLGACMYHALTGQPPFRGETLKDTVNGRFTRAPAEPETVRREIDREVSKLIMRMLSVYPSDRPGTYAEVTSALNEAVERAAPVASMTGEHTVAAAAVEPAEPKAAPKPKPKQKPKPKARRRRKPIHISPDDIPVAAPQPRNRLLAGLIPAVVIIIFIVLAIAHVRNPPWYRKHIRPLFNQRPIAAPAAVAVAQAGGEWQVPEFLTRTNTHIEETSDGS